MIRQIWNRLFLVIFLVAIPLLCVQFVQQGQALFLTTAINGILPSEELISNLHGHLKHYVALNPDAEPACQQDFQTLATLSQVTKDTIRIRNGAVLQLEMQLLANALLTFLGGALLALLVARRIVRYVTSLYEDQLHAAQKLASLQVLENWQTVARALVHELRAPISPIKLIGSGLTSKREKLGSAEYANFAEQGGQLIMSQVHLIEQMIESFTRFAKLPQPVLIEGNIVAFLTEFVSLYKDYDPQHLQINLDLEPNLAPLIARFDAGLLQRLVFNLLRNALNANPQQKIEFTISLGNASNPLTIRLENSGCAIPSHIVDHLFGPKLSLPTADSPTEGGLGLGLMICRKIALDHAGDLRLEQNHEGSVRFSLFIPLMKD